MVNRLNKKLIVWLVFLIGFLLIVYTLLFSNHLLHFVFEKKIWVHRVDSIEKLKEVEDEFYGVEVDVVFIDSLTIFDVTHPPRPSINLTLLAYLKSCKNKQLHFWLDFKNLSNTNARLALNRLNIICDSLQLNKNKFIVESSSPLFLQQYYQSGFYTSYYLPWPGLYKLKKDSLQNTIKNIIKNNNDNLYISSNYHDYKIMKRDFPQKDKLLWLTGKEKEYSSLIEERLFLYQILMDNKVKVLLIEYNSKAINR